MDRLILVANRLPFIVKRENRKIDYVKSIGGVATALRTVSNYHRSIWIGALNFTEEEINKEDQRRIIGRFRESYNSVPIILSNKEREGYYEGFCNRVLWPLLHNMPQYSEYHEEWWQQYLEVNRKFGEKVVEIAKPGDSIWIHDYHFYLLPGLLKKRKSMLKIGLSLHTPFPSSKQFRAIPYSDDLLEGIMSSDFIGVYTELYKRHLEAGLREQKKDTRRKGPFTLKKKLEGLIKVMPLGVNPEEIDAMLKEREVRKLTRSLKVKYKGKKIVLSVDRLDYTKGIPEKIKVINSVMERNPTLRASVQYIVIVAPSREKISVYRRLSEEILNLVRAINTSYRTDDWEPIHLIYQDLPQEELMAYYKVPDIALIIPLIDGMNLISKEYLYVKGRKGGALILSEKAGAATELTDAFIVDPSSRKNVVQTVEDVLSMGTDAICKKNTRMIKKIKAQTSLKWAENGITYFDSTLANQAGSGGLLSKKSRTP